MLDRIFDINNPVMRALGTICDLMVLNVLAIFCALPIVTAGAAVTALDDILLRIVRQEETRTVRGYFRALRRNFIPGCVLGCFALAAGAVLAVDYELAAAYAPALRVAVVAAALLAGAVALYAFALLARYDNTLRQTLKNAAALSAACFPRTLGMLAATVGLWLLCLRFFPIALPVLLMFGLSLPAYVNALLFDGIFKRLEQENETENEEENE